VIGVVENLGNDAPSQVPFELLFVDEDPHELRDSDGRVGICPGTYVSCGNGKKAQISPTIQLNRHHIREGLPRQVKLCE
jgi:hypothetical protein